MKKRICKNNPTHERWAQTHKVVNKFDDVYFKKPNCLTCLRKGKK